MRTVAIGLDGCSWSVLEPLIDGGDLPNLAALRERSATGTLVGVVPCNSAAGWASFVTGALPPSHAMFDLMKLDRDGELRRTDQRDLRRSPYYEQLGREAKRSVLINLPIDQHGCPGAVILNSWLTEDGARRILPVGRRDRYRQLLEGYSTLPRDPSDVDQLCRLEEGRFDLARELFLSERWDHFFVLFSATDWLGHQATGRFLEGDEDAVAAFRRLYGQLDRYVGWLVRNADDALVTVVSCYGNRSERAVLRVNGILQKLGLAQLKTTDGIQSPFFLQLPQQAKATITVPPALSRFRTNRRIRPALLTTKRALGRRLHVDLRAASFAVDTAASRAFSPTDSSFAIYTHNCSAEDVTRIRADLLAVRLPDGSSAIDSVWTAQELYGTTPAEGEPTLFFAPATGVRPSATIKEGIIDFPPASGRGCHDREGIVMLAGPSVTPGELGSVSVCDIAPTLLWFMGAGIPSAIEGQVLDRAFEPGFAATREVRIAERDGNGNSHTHERSDEVTERLRALGYI